MSAAAAVRRSVAETGARRAVVLIRFLVGAIFLSEGIQKFLFPAELGVGRFARIGLSAPEFLIVGAGPWSLDGLLGRGAIRRG